MLITGWGEEDWQELKISLIYGGTLGVLLVILLVAGIECL